MIWPTATWLVSPPGGSRRGRCGGHECDLLNYNRFLAGRRLSATAVTASDLFDWVGWQSRRLPVGKVTRLDAARGPSLATANRRVAAFRGSSSTQWCWARSR
jgi:hypothetical protein